MEAGAISRKPLVAIRFRTIPLGIALMLVNSYLMFQAEGVRSVQLSNAAPFASVILLLALLTAANALFARLVPRARLKPAELIVIYVMLCVQATMSSGRFLLWILFAVTYGFWFDTPQRGWIAEYGHHLPSWLTVQDREVLRGFYLGNSTFFLPAHLSAWAVPILMWSLFVCVLAAVLIALANLFARQWSDRERLTYPIVELPYQMVSPDVSFWGNRLMWVGFALAAGIELLNGLHNWYPSLPYIPTRRTNLASLFATEPWNALQSFNLSFYPFIIGLGFLMPIDLSFSVTFFVLVYYASHVFGKAMALDGVPNYPFPHELEFGAMLALLVTMLWSSRAHLRDVARQALRPASDSEDPAQARLYRGSLLTVVLGNVFLVGFLMAAGMVWWVSGIFVVLYSALGLIVARMRAELGLPTHMLVGLTGSHILMSTVGNQIVGLKNIPLMAVLGSSTYYNSNHPLPYQVEGLRLADRERVSSTTMSRFMLLAVLVGVVATFFIQLDGLYRLGGSAKASWGQDMGRYTWEQIMSAWVHGGSGTLYREPQWTSVSVMMGGFAFCCLLMALRHRFLWFPLHPVGLLLGYTAEDVWTGIALAMFLKWLVLRSTGLRGYRIALPFFLGLALGDLIMGMLWIVLGILLDTPTYTFFL